MNSPFGYFYTIALHDTDAAGILFSANLIRICHQAYEAFMESEGYGLGKILDQGKIGLPIVHVEGDFKNPLSVGDKIEIVLEIGGVGRSSFRVNYKLVSLSGKVYSSASTTHVCINPKTKRSMDIPDDLRAILKSY